MPKYKDMTNEQVDQKRKGHYRPGGARWYAEFVQECALIALRGGIPAEMITKPMIDEWGKLWWRLDADVVGGKFEDEHDRKEKS